MAEPLAWNRIAKQPVEHAVTYAGFVDRSRGITVGVHGWVYFTTDGGTTWTEGLNVSQCRHGLEMLPDGFAWHSGNVSVRRSFNGGKTWYRAENFGGGEPEHARFVSFADENRGFIATDRLLGATEDGGLHWKPVALPKQVREIAAVSMSLAPRLRRDVAAVELYELRKVVGRVLDQVGRIWKTDDAGRSWAESESPLRGVRFRIAANAPVTALRFLPTGVGVLAAFVEEAGRSRCRIFRTSDGRRWAEESIDLAETGTLFLSPDGELLTYLPPSKEAVQLFERDQRGDRRDEPVGP